MSDLAHLRIWDDPECGGYAEPRLELNRIAAIAT